ncbi:hypothetical protein CHS0354_028850 [Potamilus streckersoni]|uniref:SPRY domain-containing SOCS box protein 3 n=1 Tax=Potamilus streckersoni TaxID=2493646 RepID=A0AAE0WDR7_9BIVA|nr:hypothetical protein CHS0354_028850 [Potamilus streckersoni]
MALILKKGQNNSDPRLGFIPNDPENWVWDQFHKSPEVKLSRNYEDAYFYIDPVDQSTGTAGVRGTKAFSYGEHYWEIIFLEAPFGTSVMVGVGTGQTVLHMSDYKFVNLLGMDCNSWGLSYKGTVWNNGKSRRYCEPIYDEKTIIGCYLNLNNGTLAFYKNGVNLGVAFEGLDRVMEPLYPIISSTTTETEMGLGKRACRYSTLQDKCCSAIMSLSGYSCVDSLPLPTIMKKYVKGF